MLDVIGSDFLVKCLWDIMSHLINLFFKLKTFKIQYFSFFFYNILYSLFHFNLPQETGYSSLCYIVRLCCSSCLKCNCSHLLTPNSQPTLLPSSPSLAIAVLFSMFFTMISIRGIKKEPNLALHN